MVLTFFEWMEGSTLALIFQSAVWYSPLIQVAHLVAVAVFAGALLGGGPAAAGDGVDVDAGAAGGAGRAAVADLGSGGLGDHGTPTMASTAIKQYYSPFWWWKLEMLALGIVFIYTIRRRVLESETVEEGGVWPKVVALTSMGLFLGVTIGARLIGLS